jgi:hypothetical protein
MQQEYSSTVTHSGLVCGFGHSCFDSIIEVLLEVCLSTLSQKGENEITA